MSQHRLDRMLRRMARAVGCAGLVVTAALTIAACGGAGSGARPSPVGVIDQATRTVQLNLIITGRGFNGYSSGEMTVRVPRGWRVDVYCDNQTSAPASCAIVSGTGSTSPVFAGGASPHPAAGVPARASANFSFVVRTVGSYRLTSLVPGHGDRGLWDRFDVIATGRPSMSTPPRPATEVVTPRMQPRRNG